MILAVCFNNGGRLRFVIATRGEINHVLMTASMLGKAQLDGDNGGAGGYGSVPGKEAYEVCVCVR